MWVLVLQACDKELHILGYHHLAPATTTQLVNPGLLSQNLWAKMRNSICWYRSSCDQTLLAFRECSGVCCTSQPCFACRSAAARPAPSGQCVV